MLLQSLQRESREPGERNKEGSKGVLTENMLKTQNFLLCQKLKGETNQLSPQLKLKKKTFS